MSTLYLVCHCILKYVLLCRSLPFAIPYADVWLIPISPIFLFFYLNSDFILLSTHFFINFGFQYKTLFSLSSMHYKTCKEIIKSIKMCMYYAEYVFMYIKFLKDSCTTLYCKLLLIIFILILFRNK